MGIWNSQLLLSVGATLLTVVALRLSSVAGDHVRTEDGEEVSDSQLSALQVLHDNYISGNAGDNAVSAIVEAISDEDPILGEQAALLLQQMATHRPVEDIAAVREVVKVIQNRELSTRVTCAAMTAIGECRTHKQVAMPVLKELYFNDTDKFIRANAGVAMCKLGVDDPVIIHQLKKRLTASDTYERWMAALALSELRPKSEQVAIHLRPTVHDSNANVRVFSAYALSVHGRGSDLDKAIAVLHVAMSEAKEQCYTSPLYASEQSASHASVAANYLGRIAEERESDTAIQVLSESFNRSSEEVKYVIVAGMERLGERGQDLLILASNDPSPFVSDRALLALAKTKDDQM